MRKVLIATPVQGSVTIHYVESLIALTQSIRLYPEIEFGFALLTGTSVNLARNTLAQQAKESGCSDLVFVDADIGGWFPAILRLLDHDASIVGGLYTAKKLGARPWFEIAPGAKMTDKGLLEVNEIGTGFLRIRLADVLPVLEKTYPESAFIRQNSHVAPPVTMFEHFPMGIVGANSFADKIHAIKHVMESDFEEGMKLPEIRMILDTNTPGHIRGEDYFFCYRCRNAGLKIYADTKILVPHYDGATQYPMDPDKILEVAAQIKGVK